MTEEEKIKYILKLESEGAYEQCEAVPIPILQKSLITPEEMLLIEFVRKNADSAGAVLNYLKKNAQRF